ncbi:glycosyltransferase [Hymenobacter negativus]|uniref:Glycosyltransferase n=1 Tax=Hymenobacter negativus TaxID=2795026 RepID=A0ABS3QLR2_9BACT|nr:glycosyltransferase [Hymenobacter negativus]MBO2012176.1 glycosyltransferase [Hymenobacter negativus]
MPFLVTATLALTGLYLLLTATRFGLALRYLAQPLAPPAGPPAAVPAVADMSVLQAILSGDPLLEDCLRRNLRHHPEAHFLWLLDETDFEGRRVAEQLRAEMPAAHVQLVLTPPAPQGINPKSFKLQLALPLSRPVVVVLDDDTMLPPGALARAGALLTTEALVTGLPYYQYPAGPVGWAALVRAFVNANALLTYLPPLYFQSPVTINGMFYATHQATLLRLGGFAAIGAELCDDYALAQLYRRAGLPVVQSTIVHPLATTVPHFGAYLNLMRRWMVFARRLFRSSLTPTVLGLVVVPSSLPLMLVLLSLASGRPALVAGVLAVLTVKAMVLAMVRRRQLGTPESPRTVALEVLADLLQPLHLLHALCQPRRVQWRDKAIEVVADGLRYV